MGKETLIYLCQKFLTYLIDGVLWCLVASFILATSYLAYRIFCCLRRKIIGGITYPVRNEVEKTREICDELVSLRAITACDRAYVVRFHNGVEFLPSHPAWKISKTHEIVKPGVTYESAEMQNMLVSLLPDIINPVVTGSSLYEGVKVLDCQFCQHSERCIKENRRVIVVRVDEMNSSISKYRMTEQNIKTKMMCGIANNGNVYGYVGLDFCGTALTDEQILEVQKEICEKTEKIQFLLFFKSLLK